MNETGHLDDHANVQTSVSLNSKADLGYMWNLIELGTGLMSDDDGYRSIGVGGPDARSPLAEDDAKLEGYWASIVVNASLTSAIDHIHALERQVVGAEFITNAALWTLTRGVLESASTALWILSASSASVRRERTLRVWHHDFVERGRWEDDIGRTPTGNAKSGSVRATQMVEIAKRLGLRPNQVTTSFGHADAVMESARFVGLDAKAARARWREASAFAHGRTWQILARSSLERAVRIDGGYEIAFTFDEDSHRELVVLTHDVFLGALNQYSALCKSSDSKPASSSLEDA